MNNFCWYSIFFAGQMLFPLLAGRLRTKKNKRFSTTESVL